MTNKIGKSEKIYLTIILVCFASIGFIFYKMNVDIATSLVGEAIRGNGNFSVRSEVSGNISEVLVKEGDEVLPNTIIAKLDNTDLLDEIAAIEAEIIGAKAIIESKQATQKIYESELISVERLVKKGLEPKSSARSARVVLGLAEASLIEAEGQLAVLNAHKKILSGRLDRYVVKSNHAGKLLKLYRFSTGDVLQQGDVIGEIVPFDGELFFESRVSPSDIESVSVGDPAKVTLNALNRYEANPLDGEVVYVSPSSFEDENGQTYFIARISLLDNSELEINSDNGVGYTADISVKSGERSVLAFVLSPIVRGIERTFKER